MTAQTPPIVPAATAVHPAWQAVAASIMTWCRAQRLAPREVSVLVPFSALIAPLRAALAGHPGWPPRVETAQTLADALGPAPADGPGLDAGIDRVVARTLLQSGWATRESRALHSAAAAVADAAGTLARAARLRPPSARQAFWRQARAAASPTDGPGAVEQALLRVAVEWAAEGAPADDRLFEHRPAGWVLVRVGGPEPTADAVADTAEAAGQPVLRLVLDADPDDPYQATADAALAPRLWVADDAEAEAWAAAQAVLAALAAGQTPVALVALDRENLRRTRALLERAGVAVDDETGWRLSTTRAGARLMAWLRASADPVSPDEAMAWLKDWPPAQAAPAALRRLEAHWRRHRQPPAGEPLWQQAQRTLAPLTEAAAPQPLAGWCEGLARALHAAGEWEALAADPAGAAVLAALRLDRADDDRWAALAGAMPLDHAGFMAWMDAELEAASVTFPAPGAQVVLTPLARAPMRPFGAVVVGGADAGHLGPEAAPTGLIGEALAERLGLDTAARRLQRQRLALAHLLRVPVLTLLRRRQSGDETLSPSGEWQWLQLRRRQAGHPAWPERAVALPQRTVPPQPVAPPRPSAPMALPASLSASQVEQLRRCPYQFFARTLLRLSEPDELGREAEKRDYGSWLHAVLHRFHRDGGQDLAALHAAAEAELAATGFEASEMLPYRASFETFAASYLAWWAERAGEGWAWEEGEADHRVTPDALAPTGLHGRVDRVDRLGPRRRLLDYKTGRREALRQRARAGDEDVQLVFYAALLGAEAGAALLEAGYLTLDDPKAPEWLAHDKVGADATRLLQGLGDELRRLRAGAPLPALGQGDACEVCEVRGLCRRDHWSAA